MTKLMFVHMKLYLGFPRQKKKKSIQQDESSFQLEIGLTFNEQTNKTLHLENNFVWF